MKKAWLAVFLLLLSGGFFIGYRSQSAINQVCFKKHCFDVEIVQNDAERMKGLQFRKSLSPNHGMLFIFPESKPHSFWMKDTLISLDMIWMDDTRRVVHIEHNVPPCQQDPCSGYSPQQDAMYVLEINAGEAQALGLKNGDRLDFRLKKYF